jgi:hypothetical protein
MPPSLTHLLRSLLLAVLAGLLVPMILFRDVWIGAQVFAYSLAWLSTLAVGALCAVASWKLRHARSGARAAAAGFLWGAVIAATLAVVVTLATTSLSAHGSHWEERVLSKWTGMSIFAAPYVALWLGLYSRWVWRREPASRPA